MNYLRNLWQALRGGFVVSPEFIREHVEMVLQLDETRARLAAFEKRSQAGKKSHETRKRNQSEGVTPPAPQSAAQE